MATAVDHKVPWRQGGEWYDPSNLRASCVTCNSSRVRRKKRRPSREWF
ncbi:MAG: HNH endonuclease [Actinomycetia bacterium]|nr:HNH endonuclease [Actinomycetes bacterium]